MPKNKPIQILKYMSKSDADQLKNIKNLNQFLTQSLPQAMRENCGIANIKNGQLTLFATSSAWCYKLRLHSSTIIKFMKKNGIFINQVKVIVLPNTTNPVTNNLPKPVLNHTSKQILRELKKSMSNPRIQRSIDKLLED